MNRFLPSTFVVPESHKPKGQNLSFLETTCISFTHRFLWLIQIETVQKTKSKKYCLFLSFVKVKFFKTCTPSICRTRCHVHTITLHGQMISIKLTYRWKTDYLLVCMIYCLLCKDDNCDYS